MRAEECYGTFVQRTWSFTNAVYILYIMIKYNHPHPQGMLKSVYPEVLLCSCIVLPFVINRIKLQTLVCDIIFFIENFEYYSTCIVLLLDQDKAILLKYIIYSTLEMTLVKYILC